MNQAVVSRMPDGALYYGAPLDSGKELNGAGLKWEQDGSIYAGEWSAGLREGCGAAFERSGLACISMWEKDQPVGPCVLIAPADRPYFVFAGALQEGSPREGTTFFRDGRMSYGVFSEWKASEFDGEGVLMLRDKRIYAGRWENSGTAAGGVMRRVNGRVTGRLLNPRPGYMVKIWEPDAERIFFYGEASDDDARNAVGIHFYSDGGVYTGTLRGGVRQGKAAFRAADGTIQIGEWKNGVQQGLGIWLQASGAEIDFYFGEFSDTCFHGRGTQLRYHENMWSLLYCGFWEKGKRNGTGLCCLDSGELFHGRFRDGLQTEPGELILKDGTRKIFKQKAAAPAEKPKKTPVDRADNALQTKDAPAKTAKDTDTKDKSVLIHEREIEKSAGAGWGPDRPAYTKSDEIDHPIFNSVSGHPILGDERHFVRIAEKKPGAPFKSELMLEAGKQYEIFIYYKNNAFPQYNSKEFSYKSVARDTRLSTIFPSRLSAGEQGLITAKISAVNTVPKKIWDNAYVTAKEDMSIHYVIGSAKIYNKWNDGGTNLSSAYIFSDKGALIGLEELNGLILGGEEYAGYVVYTVQTAGVKEDSRKAVQNSINEEEKLKRAAEDGQADAQYKLAHCYYWGHGVEKDFAKAVEWYQKAADQGKVNALIALGDCYRSGTGVEKNLEKAAELYQKAAQAGNKEAQERLMLLSGSSLTQHQDWKVRETIIKAKKSLQYDGLILAENAKQAVQAAIASYASSLSVELVIAIEETVKSGLTRRCSKGILFTKSAIYSSYFRNTECIYYNEIDSVDLFMDSVRICPRNKGSVYFDLGASNANFVSVVRAITGK